MPANSTFTGVYPMMYAFFNQDQTLNLPLIARQVDRLIAHGVQGIGAMGLGTEVHKLSARERLLVLESIAGAVNGRVPLSVTVADNTAEGQIETVKAAARVGASWVVLQPPPVKNVPESELIRYFGSVADKSPIPVGIQNAPNYLGIGLSTDGLLLLNRQHPNVTLLKIEDGPLAVPPIKERLEGRYTIFVGRCGLEMTSCYSGGCEGFIPGAETGDRFVAVYKHIQAGRLKEAEAKYRQVEPIALFLEQSLNQFLTFGKEIAVRRLGQSETFHRLPSEMPPLARKLVDSYANELGPL